MELKYKIGDRVFVKNIYLLDGEEYLFKEFKCYIGKIGTVVKILSQHIDNVNYIVKFRTKTDHFRESELIKVDKSNKQTIRLLYGKV